MPHDGKDDFPPLLSLGFHPHDIAAVRRRCVTAFPLSITRASIMTGLEAVLGNLNGMGFKLEVWVNGSFLTEKINPDDSDVAIRIRGEEYDVAPLPQRLAFANFVKADHKLSYRCDLYAFPEYDKGHPLYAYGQWRRAYWLNKFGHDRAEFPKGLAVLTIPFVMVP